MGKKIDHIQWIDGLKGVLTIWILLFHYSIAFINRGYIGFATNYMEEEYLEQYCRNLPFSIFINSSFPLYVFMVLIAYIPTYYFFKLKSEESIIRQAKVRYFRLMIPTFISFVIAFILYHAGLLRHISAGEQSGVVWLTEMMKVDFTVRSLLYEGLIKAYISGSDYVCVSWVMGYIFIGSYLCYAILMLFGKCKNRIPIYIGLFIFLFFYDQSYICFLMGIIAADCVVRWESGEKQTIPGFTSVIMILTGFLFAMAPTVFLPKWLNASSVYGIGAALFVMGIAGCKPVQRIFSFKPLRIIGDYTFSAILIHMPVMLTFSCWQYLFMSNKGLPENVIIPCVFLAAIPVQILAVFLFQKLTVPISRMIIKKISA